MGEPARFAVRLLILSGHNGGLHKRLPRLVARARHYAAEYGFAVVAINAPGRGDRPRSAVDKQARTDLRRALQAGEAVGEIVDAFIVPLVEKAVLEWRITLDALGSPLVERLSRQVRLTPAGRAMLPHALAALVGAERAANAARGVAILEAGELHVATFYSHSLGILPEPSSIWRRSHPGVTIRLFERLPAELAAGMLAGEADVAIGPHQTIGMDQSGEACPRRPSPSLPPPGPTLLAQDTTRTMFMFMRYRWYLR